MNTETKRLCDLVEKNALKDRSRLEDFIDVLVDFKVEGGAEMEGSEVATKITLAEHVARLSDSLSKANVQILEVAKMNLEEDLKRAKPAEVKDPTEEIYDAIDHHDAAEAA